MRSITTFFAIAGVMALVLLACATTKMTPPPVMDVSPAPAADTATTDATAPAAGVENTADAVVPPTEAEPTAPAASPSGDETAANEVAPAPEATAPAAEPAPSATEAPSAAPNLADVHVTQAAIDMIKQYEGVRLEAYAEPSGIVLIGYGHSAGVALGTTITQEQAEAFLSEDLHTLEDAIKQLITVPINANELSAMVSLAFNVGLQNFGKSSVLRNLNNGDRAAAADAFLLWNRASGQVNAVLTERRQKERDMFLMSLTS